MIWCFLGEFGVNNLLGLRIVIDSQQTVHGMVAILDYFHLDLDFFLLDLDVIISNLDAGYIS